MINSLGGNFFGRESGEIKKPDENHSSGSEGPQNTLVFLENLNLLSNKVLQVFNISNILIEIEAILRANGRAR